MQQIFGKPLTHAFSAAKAQRANDFLARVGSVDRNIW